MRIFNESKTTEIDEPNLELGHLEQSTITHHFDYIAPIQESGHYEVVAEYPNGGKDVEWVVDAPKVDEVTEHDEIEDILVYVPYTDSELLENRANEIRKRRGVECFPVINRGQLWYSRLSSSQLEELDGWYSAWLDAPSSGIIPDTPSWLD